MLRNNSPPIEPRRVDAPTTATERGWKKGSSEARTARWSRSATCSRYVSVGAIANRISSSPPSPARVTAKPASRNTPSILELSANTSATNSSIPPGAAVERPEQRTPLLPVWREYGLHELRPERGKAVEAEIAAVLGQAGEELEQRVGILCCRRSQPQRRPVAENDVGCADRGRRGAQAAAACSTDWTRGRTTSTGHGAECTSPVETLPERNRRAAPQPWEPTTMSCASYSLAFRQISSTANPSTATVEQWMPSTSAASATDARSAATRWCSASVSSATMFE